MLKRALAVVALCAIAVAGAASLAPKAVHAEETIKLGYMDPFSGSFATVGDQNLKQFQYTIAQINENGGVLGKKLELVTCDTKTQPSEALVCLDKFTGQSLPAFLHCAGSSLGAALIEGVAKHNHRHPDNRIIYLNCGAVATSLTNEECSFWHFRFDANVQQKAKALVEGLPEDAKKVYLLNQDYLFGQSVDHDVKMYLKELRPDVQVVGDEFVPLGKVKDFSPYITKINASGADVLITGNWGPDMSLLIRAGMNAGVEWDYYTFYAHLGGGPTAIGKEGAGKVYTVLSFHENIPVEEGAADFEKQIADFRKDHDFEFYNATIGASLFTMYKKAAEQAGTTDPTKVASALEGMEYTDPLGKKYVMRKQDHQIQLPYYVAVFSDDVKYDSENTGLGWKTETALTYKDLEDETSCKMRRP